MPEKAKGRDLLTPPTGTDMPSMERFQTRPCGRAFNAVHGVKLSVSCWTAAEATRIDFGYWLAVTGDWFLPLC